MTTRYIIATYGISNRHRKYSWRSDTLRIHLRQLFELQHNITSITIMKPNQDFSSKECQDYYTIEEECDALRSKGIHVETTKCENKGLSNGQWWQFLERFGIHDDYYFLVEDDYCPSQDNFDIKYKTLYQASFPSGFGVLCALVQGYPKHLNHRLPEHYEGILFTSKDSLQKVHLNYHSPSTVIHSKTLHDEYQVEMSLLFTHVGIPHADFINQGHGLLYWDDIYDGYHDYTEPYRSHNTCVKIKKQNLISPFLLHRSSLCTPIQLVRRCVIVLSTHRAGSSVFSGCLYNLGIDYGKSKTQVKDSFNEKGYFENESFMHFNDKALRAVGSSWHDARPRSLRQEQQMLMFQEELTQLFKTEFQSNLVSLRILVSYSYFHSI